MSDTVLGGLTLPFDLEWIDEYADGSDLIGQNITFSSTGALILQANAKQAGRKITLQGRNDGRTGFAAMTRAEIISLKALADSPGIVYNLTLSDDREFQVVFRRDDGPAVEAEAFYHVAPQTSTNLYFPTIRLLQV